MRKVTSLFLLFLIVFACHLLKAQEKQFRSYTVDNGLAGNMVYNSYVDQKGFIWFCTESGVSRFDGSTFTNYTTLDGLSDNDVLAIFGDNEGRVWFKCFNQRPCFYFEGKIYNDKNFDELRKIQSYSWYSECVKDNVVWFPGDNLIYKFYNNKVEKIAFPYSSSFTILSKIDSNLILLEWDKLYKLNVYTYQVIVEKIEVPEYIKMLHTVIKFSDTKFGYFDLADEKSKLYIFEYKNKKVEKLCVKELPKRLFLVNSIINTNQLWFCYIDNTSEVYSIKGNDLILNEQYDFKSKTSGLTIDIQGNKWFTLLGQGTKMLNRNTSYYFDFSKETILSPCLTIDGYKDEVYYGKADGEIIKINNDFSHDKLLSNKYKNDIKTSHVIIDNLNKLWVINERNSFIKNGNNIFYLELITRVLGSIKDISLDTKSNNILISSHNGSYVIDSLGKAIITRINEKRTVSISGSFQSTIWIACIDGLYSFTNHQLKFEKKISEEVGCRILKLRMDNNNILWLATNSNGVFGVKDGNILFHITEKDGLNSNICKSLYIDKFQDIWVITNIGISRIKMNGKKVNVYKYNDKNCLLDNDVNGIYVSDKRVFVASGKGVCYFDKNIINSNATFPIYINYFQVNDKKLYQLNKKVELTCLENNITINFSGLSFLSGGDITYKYKIVELNDVYLTTKNNSVTYNELQPGTYHFIVEAIDVFGNKSDKYATLIFEIKPAWYQTFVFKFFVYALLILLIIGLVYFFTKQKLDKKRKEEDLKQLISKLELEAIRSQINPHFIFNCLNAVQNSIFKGEYEQASHYINRFAILMRKTLELSKESYISIDEEYEFIKNYMDVEKYRLNNKFNYSIHIDKNLDKSKAIIPAFILQPFIENSINHGIKYLKDEIGEILLSFNKVDKQLIIAIEDNGIGINASKEIQRNSSSKHSSKGMDLIKRRAESLNNLYDKNITIDIKDKSDISVNERGTRTIITLNLTND